MAKTKKKRSSKYDGPLKISGSFEDVVSLSVDGKPTIKKKQEKKKK